MNDSDFVNSFSYYWNFDFHCYKQCCFKHLSMLPYAHFVYLELSCGIIGCAYLPAFLGVAKLFFSSYSYQYLVLRIFDNLMDMK